LKTHPLLQIALAIGAGALLPLSLAPFDLPLFDVASIAAFYALASVVSAKGAARIGFAYGVGQYGLGASWVYVSIHDYGDASVPLAAALVALFVAVLALFPTAMALAYAFARDRHRGDASSAPGRARLADALAFAGCFVALEWLLTWFLTGFPWLYAGYAHLGDALRFLAPVGGVLLVSFAAAVSATAFVVLVRASAMRARLAAVGVAALPWLLGFALAGVDWVQPVARHRAALVQGNVPQELKWLESHAVPILDTYRRLSARAWGADLVIWPEAAITLFEHQADGYLGEMSERARSAGSALLLGLPIAEFHADRSVSVYNGAIVVGDGSGRYFKRRLVPFGEYVPLERLLRGAIAFFDLPMSDADTGPWSQPLVVAKGLKLAVAICYEVVYPDLVRASAADADAIVTISNDAWFGASIGPPQHMQMARMRALENGRWLLRATNNGITAIVDPAGRVTAQLPQFEAGVLEGEFASMRGRTPYSRYGDAIVLALVLTSLAAPALASFVNRRPR
jgi:apolipoprotein N-acyltransferase